MPPAPSTMPRVRPPGLSRAPEPPPGARHHDAPSAFAALGLPAELDRVLTQQGITEPSPIQKLTIADALAGRDVSGKAETGSGKTLAFGLPLVVRTQRSRPRRPHALVLVPTRELANQVADELTPFAAERGLWLTAIYGGVSMLRQVRALGAGVDIVIATPGRLNDLLEQGELSVADVECVVLDEADQMADMGFLPQVERILGQVEGKPQTLLFSATLDGAVGELVRRYQHEPVHYEVAQTAEYTEALEQRFVAVRREDRLGVAASICAGARRALVFVSTTRGADRLVKQIEGEGLGAVAIHGRISQNKRERALAAFRRGDTPVLVATNVAARGIHVDSVDVVVHYDPPEDAKVYEHRSGRTARAGDRGLVVTLALPEHERDITRLIQELGADQGLVAMRPDDGRLADLAAWEPPASTAARISGPYDMRPRRGGAPPRGGRGRGAGTRPPRVAGRNRPPPRGRPARRRGA